MCSVYCVFTVVMYISSTFGYNILGIFPHPGMSHFHAFKSLMIQLTELGHNVTVISAFPVKNPPKSYTNINLFNSATLLEHTADIKLTSTKNRVFKYLQAMKLLPISTMTCESLGSKNIQQLLKSDAMFDLIIIEFFITDCYLGLVHKFKVPFIGVSSCTIMPWTNDRFGNIENPSYIPTSMMDFAPRMTFIERLENSIIILVNKLIYQVLFNIPAQEAVKKYISQDVPPLEEIAKNASLLLVNTHFTLNEPRPLVPNVIEVGGLHLQKPCPLQNDLKEFIKNSPNGVIYFSMGSVIQVHSLPNKIRRSFLRVFNKLRLRVLWKWENDTMPENFSNVMIKSWMPQFDILCHPNVVVFISHGGLLGTTEAIYCGVPMIVMPQFGDQFTNARAVEAVGAGVILDFTNITEESITEALNTVLQPSFKRQIEMLSARYRDRPLSPMDTAVYWVEYVARHKGAHFMRSAALHLAWYQTLLFDVIAFILILSTLVLLCFYFTTRCLWGILFSIHQKEKVH